MTYHRGMPSLQVRDLPEAIHRKLVERARLQHRTIGQETTAILAEFLGTTPTPKERRAVLLRRLRENPISHKKLVASPEQLIREDRNR